MKNSFIYTVIFTFVLCFLFVLILSFTNSITIEKIQQNVEFEKNRAILQTFGIQANNLEEVNKNFGGIQTIEKNGITYYVKKVDGVTAYSSAYQGPGLWGIIRGYIAMDEKVSKVIGFAVTDQNETPGLGARISEKWFIEQFKNEAIINNNIRVSNGGVGDSNKDNGTIDGITGATRTSDGIQVILNQSIKQFKKDLGR